MEQKECDKLLDYYNEILVGEEKAAFESHLQDCDSCQEELAEWQELTADLPYLSEEIEPPLGMKKRIITNVTSEDSLDAVPFTSESDSKTNTDAAPIPISVQTKKPRTWMSGLLAAGLLLSLGANAYLFVENNKNEQVIEEQMSKTFKTVQMASDQGDSAGVASMVQEDKTMKLVIQTRNMSQVKGTESYQVWLIEGDKKYRAGTFTPDENGNGAVVYPVTYPGEHKWDAVAISHEPTPNSKQPKGKIVMASNL
ncbi:anti-sigma factor domain-containing protein [Bacillus sp. NEB1478]|uniref:anti-sigma factor n=1 Tax=Bacillus sp. NEB1478 TaxID=3073816 RepID=UPI002873417C|nr:anti-sigma factor [Bacillus sp. NEB1478]WNB91381.1 anti-sigma factor [Bacillus sp. NEB1478]